MEQSKLEEIKELIKKGFNLDLIAFELDIPLSQIRQLKTEIEKNKADNAENKKKYSQSYYKMSEMKQRYRRLFSSVEDKDKSDPKKEEQSNMLSPKEIQVIQTVIENIKNKMQLIGNLERKEKRTIAREILDEYKKISKYQLTIEQIEELNALLSSKELENLGIDITDKKSYSIIQIRRKLTQELAEAVKDKQSEVMDISELQELERKFIPFEIKGNEILVGDVRRQISSKILKIQQQNEINKLRNDIPTNIEAVITDLVNGNIDIQGANEIIGEEAKKRVEGKPKTRFSLTEEQIRGQILLQIRTAIIERAEQYPIQNPEKAMLQIQQLCGGELGLNISTVVRNLTARREFETAKSICSKFSGEKVEADIKAYIKILRDEIRNAEISDLVLTGLNQNEIPEKEAQCYELIKNGLEMGNVKLRAISLGKNADGSKNITLEDIWPEQIQR